MSSSINRRTVAKGAAWTLPAITVAAVAPSLAGSLSGLDVGLAVWGACFLTGVVYLLVSLKTFKASPHCTGEAS